MKKILFLNSHLYSGSVELYNSLSDNTYINGYRTFKQRSYSSHYDFLQILNLKHKRDDKHAIYLDEIYNNYALSTRMDFSKCYFIHLIRSPICLNLIKEKINPNFIIRKYLYRLRRICEVAKRTPNSIFLTFEDLKNENSMNTIKEFLSLKYAPIAPELSSLEVKKDIIPYNLLIKAEESYEKYYAFLKNVNSLRT